MSKINKNDIRASFTHLEEQPSYNLYDTLLVLRY